MTFSLIFMGLLSQNLLLPGIYHGEEITSPPGSTYWAVFSGPETDHLEQTQLVLKAYNDPIFDSENEATGKAVSVIGPHQPLFMVTGIPDLKPGPLQRVAIQESSILLGKKIEIPWKDETHLLMWQKSSGKSEYPNIANYDLVYVAGKQQQILGQFEVYAPDGQDPMLASEGQPTLIWAGDLNRDGNLDLLIDMTDHYNVSEPTLFLSLANASTPVKKVCWFRTTGC
ncbi:MAG: hypothetical protein H6510_08285 [Acidobacteria bacterium]|nr:hypothetical protein [Acidobacteriota bacterium]MCB9397798.1 hypothetical protein [Acidobacteriota bacterium]